MSTNPEAITARYVTRFQCTGSACEDNCCHGWQVPVDRRHYQILKTAMSGSKAERAEFRDAVKRDRASQIEEMYAVMKPDAADREHNCPFLDGKKLCSVQRRYGEKVLPHVCSTYPRQISQNGPRLEVWGALSCPELARQCLLQADAMDLVDAEPGLSPRMEPSHGLLGERTVYQRYLDDIRGTAFNLLSLRDYPMSTRLFLLAYLGKQTAGIFNKETREIDEGKLAAAIDHVSNPQTISMWNQELATLPASEALTANLVSQLITDRLKVAAPSFRALVDQTLASYGTVGATSLSDLWAVYSARRDGWLKFAAERIDLYFENYAKNYWMREWYVKSPDLLTHTQRLLVRVAVLRFLLFSHPSLIGTLGAEPAARQEALDRAAVEVFYKFSRAIEHDNVFVEQMGKRLLEQGAGGFTHAAMLALV